jgi:outer membrane biosynthesis protein TonB
MEFEIDRRGKAVSIKIVQAEADHILQDGALRVIRGTTFDVRSLQFDAANSIPFRVTIKFCMPNCSGIATFPDSQEVAITAPLRH